MEKPRAQTCRVVTTGRRTGAEHIVQVWFVVVGSRLYAASRHGLRGDWVQNGLHRGSLEVRSGGSSWRGAVSIAAPDVVSDVLDAFAAKYSRYRSIIEAWHGAPPVLVEVDLSSEHSA